MGSPKPSKCSFLTTICHLQQLLLTCTLKITFHYYTDRNRLQGKKELYQTRPLSETFPSKSLSAKRFLRASACPSFGSLLDKVLSQKGKGSQFTLPALLLGVLFRCNSTNLPQPSSAGDTSCTNRFSQVCSSTPLQLTELLESIVPAKDTAGASICYTQLWISPERDIFQLQHLYPCSQTSSLILGKALQDFSWWSKGHISLYQAQGVS